MDKEKKVISKKTKILIIVGVLVVLYVGLWAMYHKATTPDSGVIKFENGLSNKSITTVYSDTWRKASKNSNVSYEINYGEANKTPQYYLCQRYNNIFVKSESELKEELYNAFGSDNATIYDENGKNQISISEKFNDEFFENHNLAIEMHCSFSKNVSIVSVVNSNSSVEINENEEFNGDANYVYAIEPEITFITLDKDVKEVNFNVYRTTITRRYKDYIPLFIIEGIFLTIIIIIVLLLIISVHNKKIESNLNESKQKQSAIKKIIIIIVIVVLVIIALFSLTLLVVGVDMKTVIACKPIIYLYSTEEVEITAKLGCAEKSIDVYSKLS